MWFQSTPTVSHIKGGVLNMATYTRSQIIDNSSADGCAMVICHWQRSWWQNSGAASMRDIVVESLSSSGSAFASMVYGRKVSSEPPRPGGVRLGLGYEMENAR
eukprot:Blabericola_migrator_1__8291@NODE_4301_length_1231_cov_3_659794_g2659_i0_p1_GENE_NODE_4301_length_1231_cov_3_659794_g2659_i0NODE_4301_length_1231_cov_3_659794_g2659_i0_p1_ORF_typecomplete_len103_score2_87_NODE_4301_length_1231_cov_3_659794_g2659_i0371679